MSYCFISSLPGPFTSLEISKRNLTKILSLFCRSKIYQLCLWKFYYSNIVVLAFSQTLYFLFKVRLARVIRYKPRGIYWPPAQGGSVVLADVFEKNEKKNKTMSVHRLLLIRLPRECLGYVTEMTERHRTGRWQRIATRGTRHLKTWGLEKYTLLSRAIIVPFWLLLLFIGPIV